MRVLRILVVVLALDVCAKGEETLAPATIVIFNSNIAESQELAKFYAQKRGIARDHLVGHRAGAGQGLPIETGDDALAVRGRPVLAQLRLRIDSLHRHLDADDGAQLSADERPGKQIQDQSENPRHRGTGRPSL